MDRCEPTAVLDGMVSVFGFGSWVVVMMYLGYAFLALSMVCFVASVVAQDSDAGSISHTKGMLYLIAGILMVRGF